ncbi:mucin-5AC-like [Pelobates cultripes]|uniref:Mucin-5AC-like, partial n=1 Tax=Pelobates cultripes TaxID=61616 RepID=A0AAD1TI18_PELCU|nr:mucin-5AC-like [Pelobates cultripes]
MAEDLNVKESGVCSTWGNFHFKTFDGKIFSFPGLCNYRFASHCGKHYEDFNIQIQQAMVDNLPTITQISMKVNGLVLEIIDQQPYIHGDQVTLPYSQILAWHEDKSVQLTLNKKYMGETCGLCSNYDSDQKNDFTGHGLFSATLREILTPLKFGNLHKLKKPGQKCIDPKTYETLKFACYHKALSYKMLASSMWAKCNRLVKVTSYIEAYMEDLCLCNSSSTLSYFCKCNTISEYSRQCALAGGKPPDWRNHELCSLEKDKTCPLNLIYKECSSPCVPTCSNPGRPFFCEGMCVSGCVCPTAEYRNPWQKVVVACCAAPPSVLDATVRDRRCTCWDRGRLCSSYNAPCYKCLHSDRVKSCLCSGGHWNCEDLPCPSSCSVEGGSHITTFDKVYYTFHGKCLYVLTKPCADNAFLVTVEMQKCAYSETATCLTRVLLFLDNGKNIFEINWKVIPCIHYPLVTQSHKNLIAAIHGDEPNCKVLSMKVTGPQARHLIGVWTLMMLLPQRILGCNTPRPSNGELANRLGLVGSYKRREVAFWHSLRPANLVLRLPDTLLPINYDIFIYQGLCGNFNSIQKDDFRTSNGAIEGNVADFANTWKTQHSCMNIQIIPEHPCTYGLEIVLLEEEYWCGVVHTVPMAYWERQHLQLNEGWFAVSPLRYPKPDNCLFDTCSCKRAEDCLCASLSSYAWACAVAGIPLIGWREEVCNFGNYMSFCPPSFIYSYSVTTCIPTCRSLNEPDPTCSIKFFPVDGCVCPPNTYLDDHGVCVKIEHCSCNYKGVPVFPDKPLYADKVICSCTKGQLLCTEKDISEKTSSTPRAIENRNLACPPPMTYFDCGKAEENAKGSECPQSCQTPKTQCYSPLCVSGCLCPKGLFLNDNDTCVKEEQCPCVHNGISYQPGDYVSFHCDLCVCKNRTWVCDKKPDKGICTVYGEGHHMTFDNKWYTASGDCEYTLLQDYCDADHLQKGTFRINIENIPCGTTGTSCSKAILVYLGVHKLILTDGQFEVVRRASNIDMPYKVRSMGNFLVIETMNGIVLIWDRKTSIFIHLSIAFKGKVCGLCGNFDGNSNNDFTTRSQCVVEEVTEFRDSWRLTPECPEVYITKEPCAMNPYRVPWAQKRCSIITSEVFSTCHDEVDPEKYYESCVSDTCACDVGGDCECLCTAIAAYAQACSEACVCVDWRTADVCPMFCDFYNTQGHCEWHYRACGAPCMKTCRNPSGICMHHLKGLEGCYPVCPEEKPYFSEDEMLCVSQCGCLDDNNSYYKIGEKVESCNSCESCTCTAQGIICEYDIYERDNACYCEYEGQVLDIGESFQIGDKFQNCITVTCGLNGTVMSPCYATATTTSDQKYKSLLKTSEIVKMSRTSTVLTLNTANSEVSKTHSGRPSYSPTTLETTPSITKHLKHSKSPTKHSKNTQKSFTLPTGHIPTTTQEIKASSSQISDCINIFLHHAKMWTRKLDKNRGEVVIAPVSSLHVSFTFPCFASQLASAKWQNDSLSGDRNQELDNFREPPFLKHTGVFIISQKKSDSQFRKNTYYSKCVNVTCLDNGELDVDVLPCSDVKKVTCDNDKKPRKIYDKDGCCYHYECEICLGTDGIKRLTHIGNGIEKWRENCQTCSCDKNSLKISCTPLNCLKMDPQICDKPWLKPFRVLTESDNCCPRIECGCIPAKCNNQAPKCPLGHSAFPMIDNDECCINFECRPMDVCVYEGTVYEVGKLIGTEKTLCKTCHCTDTKDIWTGLNAVSCTTVTCNVTCPQGFLYEKSNNDCCGQCVQVSCIGKFSNGSLYLLQPGESQFLGQDKCTIHTCEMVNQQFVMSSQKTMCPELHEEECESVSFMCILHTVDLIINQNYFQSLPTQNRKEVLKNIYSKLDVELLKAVEHYHAQQRQCIEVID